MRTAFFVGLVLSAALVTGAAAGQGAKKTPARAAPSSDATMEQLRSSDEGKLREGLDNARIAGPGGAAYAPIIASRLEGGLSLALTEAAIETLADLEAATASAAVARYVSHRSVKIRRAAAKALARVKGPAAAPTLRKALSDSDAGVRATAATALGSLKAQDAVDDLFTALDHKVVEAAASIGQLCKNDKCVALAERIGRMPFDLVLTGVEAILFRPAADVSDDTKIKIVGRIRELGTQEANKFLRDVQGKWPKNGSARVKQAIEQAVLATSGGTK